MRCSIRGKNVTFPNDTKGQAGGRGPSGSAGDASDFVPVFFEMATQSVELGCCWTQARAELREQLYVVIPQGVAEHVD